MRLILVGLLVATSLFANNTFKQDVEYTCINTYTIQQNVKYKVNKKDTKQKPLKVTIVKDKIYTKDEEVFDFLVQRGDMSSYSNTDVMLLLTDDLELGLVPKKEKGQLQYYFKCEKV